VVKTQVSTQSPGSWISTGVRVDTWVETGTEISPFYDSLIGKLMVHGRDRKDATAKMLRALAETRLGGIPNNLQYHTTILSSEGFASGAVPPPPPLLPTHPP